MKYVYISDNKLTISDTKITDTKYQQLLHCEYGSENLELTVCKMFCMGLIIGNNFSGKIVNDINEFR